MDKLEFRKQRRDLIQVVNSWDRRVQLVGRALAAHQLLQPVQPAVATDTNEWSDYLFDLAEWQAKKDALEDRRDNYINAKAISQKRLDNFLPTFSREEDPGE